MKKITQTVVTFILWAFIFVGASYTYAAWSEPSCVNPALCNVSAPINEGSASQTKEGFLWAVGIGSTAGGYFTTTLGVATSSNPAIYGLKALIGGKVGADQYCNATGTSCFTATTINNLINNSSSVPTGAVMSFNLSACPTGWTEATAVQGRYIVGKPTGGTLGGTTGTALSNLEDRPTGRHAHTYDQPVSSGKVTGANSGSTIYGPSSRTSGYTGAVNGTNAPYIQYLMCQKS